MLNDQEVFNPPIEKSLEAFLQEQINQKAFAVAFKEWYGRYGSITFEKNLSGELEPIWHNSGTRENWSVKSMADVFMLGFRYGKGFKAKKMNCEICESHLGTEYSHFIVIEKGIEHYFCEDAYCIKKWIEAKEKKKGDIDG